MGEAPSKTPEVQEGQRSDRLRVKRAANKAERQLMKAEEALKSVDKDIEENEKELRETQKDIDKLMAKGDLEGKEGRELSRLEKRRTELEEEAKDLQEERQEIIEDEPEETADELDDRADKLEDSSEEYSEKIERIQELTKSIEAHKEAYAAKAEGQPFDAEAIMEPDELVEANQELKKLKRQTESPFAKGKEAKAKSAEAIREMEEAVRVATFEEEEAQAHLEEDTDRELEAAFSESPEAAPEGAETPTETPDETPSEEPDEPTEEPKEEPTETTDTPTEETPETTDESWVGSGDLSKAKVRSPFDKIALSMTTSFLTKPIDAGESPSGEEEDDRTVEQKVDGMKLLGFRVFVALSDKSWMRVLDEPQKESLHNQTGITINTSGAEVTVSWDEKETKEADETKEKPNAITKGTIDALEAGLGPDYRDTLDAVGVKMDGNLTLDQINTFLADKEGPEADELKAFAEDLNDLGVKPSEPLGTALAELGEVELGVLKEKRESREGAAGEAPSETVDVNREAMEALNDPENGVYLVEYKGDDPLLQGMGTFLLVSDQSNLTKEGIDALLAEPSGQRAIVRPIDGVWSIVGAAGAEEVNESHASGEEALAAAKAFFEANPIADVGEVPTEEETTTEEGPEVQDEAIVKQIEALNNPTEGVYAIDASSEGYGGTLLYITDTPNIEEPLDHASEATYGGLVAWDPEGETWLSTAKAMNETEMPESEFDTPEAAIQAVQNFLAENTEAPAEVAAEEEAVVEETPAEGEAPAEEAKEVPEAIVTEIEGLHNPSEGLYLFDYDGEGKMPPMILVLDEYDLSPEALADHDMDHVGAVFWDVESESWGMIAEGADGTDTEEISGFATSEEAIQATQTFLAEHAEAPPAETGDGVTEVGPDEFEEEAGTIETGSASYSLGPKGPEL